MCPLWVHIIAKPTIADYNIVSFNHKLIKFCFQVPNSNKKNFLILKTKKLIKRLVSHIATKNFKLIRRYKLYSQKTNKENLKFFLCNIKYLIYFFI